MCAIVSHNMHRVVNGQAALAIHSVATGLAGHLPIGSTVGVTSEVRPPHQWVHERPNPRSPGILVSQPDKPLPQSARVAKVTTKVLANASPAVPQHQILGSSMLKSQV